MDKLLEKKYKREEKSNKLDIEYNQALEKLKAK